MDPPIDERFLRERIQQLEATLATATISVQLARQAHSFSEGENKETAAVALTATIEARDIQKQRLQDARDDLNHRVAAAARFDQTLVIPDDCDADPQVNIKAAELTALLSRRLEQPIFDRLQTLLNYAAANRFSHSMIRLALPIALSKDELLYFDILNQPDKSVAEIAHTLVKMFGAKPCASKTNELLTIPKVIILLRPNLVDAFGATIEPAIAPRPVIVRITPNNGLGISSSFTKNRTIVAVPIE